MGSEMLEYTADELLEQLTASKATYAALVKLDNRPDDWSLSVCVKSMDDHIKDLLQELGASKDKPVLEGRAKKNIAVAHAMA